jgi:UDP-GlcNAc:undecaprenyl-phosphate/decaprenyl-phosphate GlcNAc-1-phosphate transferase
MVLSLISGATELALVAGSLALALLAFLAFNLELPFFRGRKIFLGDGGSTFLGFLVLWLLVVASQKDISFRPITAVWLVGLPIVDMLTVFVRRAFAGKSPFSADRTHIHHLLMESGMSARQTLLVLLGFHASLVAFGVAGEMLYWSDLIMTLGAIGAGALYGAVNISLTSRQQKAAASPQQQ